ncbi:BQ5605_C037g11619 [Microbotryum silenes-dioicae]|uniref:BQ5605_C037g11619 protein n=1 Tax=Microbotryum silenes-dioicae TaxID=796604 RepID=A0A2X0PG82_9BASI|nr:BQ5605_C037g11619 [Microbotryum silenes-dioicae]
MSSPIDAAEGSAEKHSLERSPSSQSASENQAPTKALHKLLGEGNKAPLPRTLQPRHLSFVAIGGTIGTGIFFSLGSVVATGGAGGALVAYILVGIFCFAVVLTLGEMASLIPVSGAFSTFGSRFVSPALGFTLGWSYWLQWSFSIPSELIAASIILSYWTDKLKTWEWSLIIILPVFAFNCLGTRAWGESEYWLALIKVIMIVLFIIVGLIYDWGGVIGHPGPGLSNFRDGPFFDGFSGVAKSFTFAFYSYGGVELVALAAGESANPHKSIPRAIKATFIRIVLFYVLTVLVVGLCINRNDPSLFSAYDNSDVAASPITTVFRQAGFGAAVHVVNAVLLTAVLSATNSCFYASSRMMTALARENKAPAIMGWTTKRGVPIPALLLTLFISFLTFLTSAIGTGATFTWLLSITGILSLVTWISIAAINLRFRAAFKAQRRDVSDLPYRAPLGLLLPVLAMVLGAAMFGAQGWAATTYEDGKMAQDLVAVYIGLVYFIILFVGYCIWHKFWMKSDRPLLVPLLECDFDTGAVWGAGAGQSVKAEDAEEKRLLKAEKGHLGYAWLKIRGSVW